MRISRRNFVGPSFLAIFLALLFFLGGTEAILGFASSYLGFMGQLILGIIVAGGMIFSTILIHQAAERRWGDANGAVVLFLYVFIGLPLVAMILSLFL